MASVNAVIRVGIDASAANAGLASMAGQMSKFNKGMIQGSAAMSAAQVAAASRTAGALNRTGQWIASTGSMMTATGRMAAQFDKGTAKSFGSFARNTSMMNRSMTASSGINQLAASRVRALQTQYTALGREVDGVQQVMKAQPTGMVANRAWGSSAEFAAQRAILFRRNLTMGANSMINWGKNTQWAGRQMMVGMGVPMALAAVGAVRSFKDIEAASISFKRVYGDATTSAGEKATMLGKIQGGVAQEMTKYGVAVADTLDVAAKAAATGQKGDDLIAATRETMRIATLGNMDYMTALEGTIATQTAFGVSAKGMTRVTDFMNAAENQTILSMEDMSKAVPRVAPVIRGLGGDVEDLGVLMTALRAGGVTAEQGANALKSGLASLINPTSTATEAMDSFGIPLDKIVKANKGDLIGTVQSFGKALGDLPKFQQQQALESLFGKYQYARMGALFRNINGKQARETARLSKANDAELAKISAAEQQTISESPLKKFEGAIERLKAAAAPLGGQILSGLTPLIDMFAGITDFFATNDVAGKVLLWGAAFAGLAGLGTMLTGVFANFFGTMIKGGQMMHRAGRFMIGKPLPKYNSIADLEATAAQRQLASAAEAASASLYGERGAVTQLAAALNAMNAELRESVGLQAAAAGPGKRPPGAGGAPVVPAPKPPPPPPVTPRVSPPIPRSLPLGPTQRRAGDLAFAKAHLSESKDRAAIKAFYSNAANRPSGAAAAKFDRIAKVLESNPNARLYNSNVMAHSADINRQQELGAGVKRQDLLSDIGKKGGFLYSPQAHLLGLDQNDPKVRAAATNAAMQYYRSIESLSGETVSNSAVSKAANDSFKQHFVQSGLVSQSAYDRLMPSTHLADGRSRLILSDYAKVAGTEGLNYRQAGGGTQAKFLANSGFSTLPNTFAALAGAGASLEGAAGALKAAAGSLAAAGKAAGGKPGAAPGQRGYTTSTGGAYRGALGYGPDPSRMGTSLIDRQIADVERQRQSAYSKGFFAQQAELERSQREATKKQSLWNRMWSGGVFGGGTRGMDPNAKLMAKDKMKSGVSNKLFAMGMAADAVTMGLAMTGHEIPAWTHAIGMSAMALGMFPGAITPIVSMLSNPVTAGVAGIAAAAGGLVLAYNYAEEQSRQSGISMGEMATLGQKSLGAMEEAYQTQSLYTQVMTRRAAQEAEVSESDYTKAQGIAESEYGKALSENFAQAVKSGGQSFAESGLANQLAQGVLQKVISAGDAKALTETLIGGTSGETVRSQLTGMIGKNGQLVSSDPFGFASSQLRESTSLAKKASSAALFESKNGVDWGNALTEIPEESPWVDAMQGTPLEWSANMGQSIQDSLGNLPGVPGDLFSALGSLRNVSEQAIEAPLEDNARLAQSEGYAASMWGSALSSGYQNRIAAEERLRLAQVARQQAQKQMTSLEDQGLKKSQEYEDAAKSYANAQETIANSKKSSAAFNNQMGKAISESIDSIAGLENKDQRRQILDTGWQSLAARYQGDASRTELMIADQQMSQLAAAQLKKPRDQAAAEASAQAAMRTGMMPGDLAKYSNTAGMAGYTGGQELLQLGKLMTSAQATGGDIMGAINSVGQISGNNKSLVQGLFGVSSPEEFQQYNKGLANLAQLGPKAQQALKPFVQGGAGGKETSGWVKDLQEGNKTLKQVTAGAERNQARRNNEPAPAVPMRTDDGAKKDTPGSRPGTSDRSFSTSQDRGAPKPTPLGLGAKAGSAIKPDLGAATAAGKAEGQARGTAMASTVLQKAKASGQPMQAVAKQAGTQQGKIQGQAIGAGIGSSLGKTKSQAGKALSSIGKGGNQGQIKLKVDDGGATAKINKVKSAMGKLKGGKGGDIKLKATDNASSKIQKVTSKAKQLKNAKTDIKIKASDNASAKLTKVKAKANALKNAKANIPIKAQDNASPKLSEVKSKAANLQGLNINVPIKATDNASAPANQAKTAITAVGQLAPNPTINANAAPAIVGAAMATAAIAAIPSSKTVTINVVKTGAIAGGGLIDSVYLAGGGEPLVRGNFSGRRVSGPGGPTDDKVPAWLSAGEFVMRQKAVNKYGSTFMSRVNSGSIDPKSVLHLKDGSGNDNSKKKGSDDSGGKEDKDTGWKDWTKEVKKLSKSWDKASKLAVKMKVSNPLLASLFGTGSPNAIGKFNPKKSKQIKKQFKKKQLMESLQATFDTLSENEKMAKAAQARVKLLKKHKGLSEDINRLEADELLAIKKSKNSKAVLKKVMKARNAASDAMFAQEWQSFADESTQSQALNAKRVELANSQKNPEYKKLMLQLTDEEVKQYNATKPGKREQFLIRRRKAMLAQEAFEKEVAKEERLSDLRGQKDFSNRFSNKEFQSLAIESPAAAAGMTEEDYEIMQSLSGDELEKFRKALIQAAEAASATSRATEILNKKAEYAAMTLGQQFQEGTDLLNQKSQAMRDEQAAIGEQKIIEATGKTRNQLEAEIGTRGVEVSRFQHQQELEQRHMDDINEKYNEQAKLLDDISQAQQIISSLQRGRLSVANALSSGDIAAAAAAAQEQRASEAQASIDMMKSALEKERDDRLKEHQDRIDEAQDSIDTLNDQIFEYQHAMDSIAATYALIGADTSVNIDKLNTSLQAQSGYWAAVVKDIDEYINALKEINPNVLELPEPSQTTPTTTGDSSDSDDDNNSTSPAPLTPRQKKAVKIADKVEKKAKKAMDKAQDAKSAAKKTQTKKDDKKAKKAINKAKKIEGLADKADKVALTGDVGKAKELNQNAKQKLENVNNKVGSVNVVASKADSKVADKKVDNLQDKLKAAKEDDDRKKAKALAAKLEKAKEDAKKAENAKQQAQAAAKKKADDDEKARQKKKADDDENRKKQSQEAEKQRKKKEEDNKKAQAQNKNKKNNGGFITKKYAGGGFVGGVGNTDKVPALLTPGEFVMTKGSAARYGKALEKVNSPSYKFASSAAGYSGGSAMGTSIYNLTVNAQTNADANDIATITIKRIQDMERTRIRERKV